VLTARGGGTGTNGQSLTDGIVVDLSRHMNRILEIDPEARRVRVQAGVVKDQLNAALLSHGLFFAPELSTSNRATVGGMINTDASGRRLSCHDRDFALSSVHVPTTPSSLCSKNFPPQSSAMTCPVLTERRAFRALQKAMRG
jgi:hypothetical protein